MAWTARWIADVLDEEGICRPVHVVVRSTRFDLTVNSITPSWSSAVPTFLRFIAAHMIRRNSDIVRHVAQARNDVSQIAQTRQ